MIFKNIISFDELGSTNTYLMENADKFVNGTVVTTKYQTKGKGRQGKTWIDSGSQAVCMSILLKDISKDNFPYLPLVCGLSVKKALSKFTNCNISVKWPNDILICDKKICGILCEGKILPNQSYAICGIGVNVLQEKVFFFENNMDFATSLFAQTGKKYKIEIIIKEILLALDFYINILISEGFSSMLSLYKQSCTTLNRHVKIIKQNQTITAFAKDISNKGELICTDTNGNDFIVCSGEVSIRNLY